MQSRSRFEVLMAHFLDGGWLAVPRALHESRSHPAILDGPIHQAPETETESLDCRLGTRYKIQDADLQIEISA